MPQGVGADHAGFSVRNYRRRHSDDSSSIDHAYVIYRAVHIDVHELKVLGSKSLPLETAWGVVQTPSF